MTLRRPIRVLLVAASPVFYQVPLYRLLETDQRLSFTALFASSAGVRAYQDAEFGRSVTWGEDLARGYPVRFAAAAEQNDIHGGFFALRDGDIFREVLHGSYDVIWIHGYSYLSLWLAAIAARLSRKALMIREEQTLLDRRPWYRALPRMLVLRALFARTHGLFIGTANRRFFQHYGASESRLHWVPYAANNQALQRTASKLVPQRARLRAGLGISSSSGPVLIFVGKLIPKKQPLELLEAFARVRARYRCALLFVGDGELRASLLKRVIAGPIPDVHLAGFLDRTQIAGAFAVADILALPSAFRETWGVVVNEAMNFALPVIVSDRVGSAVDLVEDGRNGYVVPYDRTDILADRIERLVADAGLRQRFGQRSLEIISRWTHHQAAEGIAAACMAAAGATSATKSVR